MSDPQSKIDVGSNFQQQIRKLAAWAERADVTQEDPPLWYIPEVAGWSGNLFDLEGMSEPFTRSAHSEDFANIVKDTDNPGTTGDLILTALQGDTLAAMERAYRARHK